LCDWSSHIEGKTPIHSIRTEIKTAFGNHHESASNFKAELTGIGKVFSSIQL